MNIDCPKKDTCDCDPEQKWLQGKPEGIKDYSLVRTFKNCTGKPEEVIFTTECFCEAEDIMRKKYRGNYDFPEGVHGYTFGGRTEQKGIRTTVYCKVLKQEWIEVNATTLDEAVKKAEAKEGVIKCLEASYIPGGAVT